MTKPIASSSGVLLPVSARIEPVIAIERQVAPDPDHTHAANAVRELDLEVLVERGDPPDGIGLGNSCTPVAPLQLEGGPARRMVMVPTRYSLGGCQKGTVNCLPITAGCNHTVRLCRALQPLLEGIGHSPLVLPLLPRLSGIAEVLNGALVAK